MIRVLEKVLDLNGNVVGEVRKFLVKPFDKRDAVTDSVEKVRIAKGDMFCTIFDLIPNVLEHDFSLYDSEFTLVDRDNGTVPAHVLAAASGLGIANRFPGWPVHLEFGVFGEFG